MIKYILPLLLISCLTVSSCSSKQKQFVTTLTIDDSITTNVQIDTVVLVLKKRLEMAKFKDVIVTANYKEHLLTIQSAALDKDWIKTNLLKKGALIFYECYSITELADIMNEADKMAAQKIAGNKTDTSSHPLLSAFYSYAQQYTIGNTSRFPSYIGEVTKQNIPRLKKYFELSKELFPADAALVFKEENTTTENAPPLSEVYVVKENDTKFFASNYIKKASAKADGKYNSVEMSFDAYGTYAWKRMTERNINKAIAMVMDGKVLTVPTVINTIEGGNSIISGVLKKQEAHDFADLLSSGYLPVNCSLKEMHELEPAE
ncbi:SecDF P1 head subdomain-containing protein [Ferruginibacter sp. SUN106]|uniref:SecDF P1 head subdomain-containing protein n=1 Tax=Ferruginibacter sp. SUN106 TaxID=2978348 RepID=UPI003D36CE2C